MDDEEDTFATPGSALALLLKKGSDYVDENVNENEKKPESDTEESEDVPFTPIAHMVKNDGDTMENEYEEVTVPLEEQNETEEVEVENDDGQSDLDAEHLEVIENEMTELRMAIRCADTEEEQALQLGTLLILHHDHCTFFFGEGKFEGKESSFEQEDV